jgi:hypothetical protein
MKIKKISVKGLADYMAASASRQRTILRQFKYPLEDEAQAKIVYYREARDRVVALHRSSHAPTWLQDEAAHLDNLAGLSTGGTRTRLKHNSRALRDYARHFANRQLEVLPEVRLALRFSDVLVTVVPDLHVREKEGEKIIKLEFGVDPPEQLEVQVISQAMFEAAQVAGLKVASSSVLYLDVARGLEYHGARLRSRMRKNLESACLTISDVWDSI